MIDNTANVLFRNFKVSIKKHEPLMSQWEVTGFTSLEASMPEEVAVKMSYFASCYLCFWNSM